MTRLPVLYSRHSLYWRSKFLGSKPPWRSRRQAATRLLRPRPGLQSKRILEFPLCSCLQAMGDMPVPGLAPSLPRGPVPCVDKVMMASGAGRGCQACSLRACEEGGKPQGGQDAYANTRIRADLRVTDGPEPTVSRMNHVMACRLPGLCTRTRTIKMCSDSQQRQQHQRPVGL